MNTESLACSGNTTRWLQVGTLIDGESETPITNGHVVFNAESILHAGADAPPPDLVDGRSVPDLILPDHTLLPGLIEAHAHLFLRGGELDIDKRKSYLSQSPDELLVQAQRRIAALLHSGIIAIRDAGDKDGVGLALSKAYRERKKGDPLMPYIDSPGAAIHHRGRYGSFMGSVIEDHASAADCVAARVADGADRIKLIPTSIINFKKGMVTAKPQMDAQRLRDLADAAKHHGRQTFAHASGDEGIDHVIEAGIDTVEHGYFIRPDQLDLMAEKNIAWVPTFAPVQKQIDHAELMGWDDDCLTNLKNIIENHQKSLLYADQIGVTIIAGSDAGSHGVSHGDDFIYELELMEQAGLDPIKVINTATGNSANRLNFSEPFGRINAGGKSRMILTAHRPQDTVSNLRKNQLCLFDGHVIPTSRNGKTI
jgi:imidazolonepropionase-like amidohydrolase